MESLSPWELLGQQPCPLRRLRASSPRGRALGKPVKFPLDEQSLFVSWTVVPCCLGQRQLDKVRCPEAAALCSKARPFTSYRAFSGQAKVARPAKGSPFGGAGERSETERASRLSQSRCTAISRLFVRAILSQCKSCLSASLPSPSAAQTPLPEGEALAFRIVSCIFLAKFMIYLFCGLARPFYWEGGEHHESIFISYPVRRSKHNFTLCLQVA